MSSNLTPPPNRKRLSREESKALTRSRLLEAAQALFALSGYEGTSIDQIADRAGYSRGAFYSNFQNKADLMMALIRRCFDGDIDVLQGMRGATSLEEMPELFSQYAQRFYGDPTSLLWILESQLSVIRHPELRTEYVKQYRRLRSEVADLIENMFRRLGHTEPSALRRYADVFIVLQSGLSLNRLIDRKSVSESLFGETFELLQRGIEDSSFKPASKIPTDSGSKKK